MTEPMNEADDQECDWANWAPRWESPEDPAVDPDTCPWVTPPPDPVRHQRAAKAAIAALANPGDFHVLPLDRNADWWPTAEPLTVEIDFGPLGPYEGTK